jgi:hypothetical protein
MINSPIYMAIVKHWEVLLNVHIIETGALEDLVIFLEVVVDLRAIGEVK